MAAVTGDDPGEVVVRGGTGGTRAALDALTAAAGRADRAGDLLRSAEHAARRAHAEVLGVAPGGPAGGAASGLLPSAEDALARLSRGPGRLGVPAERAAGLARALRAVASTYASADDDAAARLRAAVLLVAHRVGEAGPGVAVMGVAAGGLVTLVLGRTLVVLRVLRRSPSAAGLLLTALTTPLQGEDGVLGRLLAGDGVLPARLGLPHGDAVEAVVPVAAAWLLGALPGSWPLRGDPVTAVASLAVAAAAVGAAVSGRRRRGVLVAPLLGRTTPGGGATGGGATGGGPAPTGLADVVRQVAELGDAPGPVVGVQRLDHADGTRSWVVAVPGTRSMALGGADPMDNLSNVALVAGRPDAMTHAVRTAMLRAGIGPDEPVVLAGHSQGGLVVTRVARSLQDTYDVAAVVTAGSPVGGTVGPRGVPMLHLEHAQDWVPALDGHPNPDTPTRTTVVRTLPAGRGGLLPNGVGDAHEAWRYVETAEALADEEHRSVRDFRAALERALGDGTARASRQTYLVVRVPG